MIPERIKTAAFKEAGIIGKSMIAPIVGGIGGSIYGMSQKPPEGDEDWSVGKNALKWGLIGAGTGAAASGIGIGVRGVAHGLGATRSGALMKEVGRRNMGNTHNVNMSHFTERFGRGLKSDFAPSVKGQIENEALRSIDGYNSLSNNNRSLLKRYQVLSNDLGRSGNNANDIVAMLSDRRNAEQLERFGMSNLNAKQLAYGGGALYLAGKAADRRKQINI